MDADASAPSKPAVSVLARIGNGVLLPLALFLLWQFALIESTRGTGSWAGMLIFFGSLILVPALVVLDLWVLAVPWRGHFRAFFAGLALPAVVGAIEAWAMFASGSPQQALERLAVHPLAPLVPILMCAPLIAAVTHLVMRKKKH
ncbi:MAG TPA: hypothetical protein VMU46_09105 [Burkholderiales bacterium]|nr:hypothetical protein [Burkholderiales bacterium]